MQFHTITSGGTFNFCGKHKDEWELCSKYWNHSIVDSLYLHERFGALTSNCWQVLKVLVFAVHRAVGIFRQKKCFSCSINSAKWLNEKLALFHCAIYGIITYVMLLPLAIFICMFICYFIQRK